VRPMQLVNNGTLYISISLKGSASMPDAEKWAEDLNKSLRGEKDAATEQARVVQMKREIVAERFPQIWDELRALYRQHVDAFNAQRNPRRKLSCFESAYGIFTIKPDAQDDMIVVQYDPTGRTIKVIMGRESETYRPKARMHGDGAIVLESNSGEWSLESIVHQSLERGIRSVDHNLDAL